MTFEVTRTPPQDFVDETAREAAHKRVLLKLSQDEQEKELIREMANDELKCM